MHDTLLIELLTEELPPKALKILGEAFGNAVLDGLVRAQLKDRDPRGTQIYATPRRLAVSVPTVLTKAADREAEATGPSLKVGLGPDGKPTAALAGFAKKNGVAVEALEQRDTPKGKVFIARVTVTGVTLDAALSAIVAEAVKKLPIPKLMRWGDGDAQFVRPVHGLIMLHGARVVPGAVLGIESSNQTLGHRFLGSGPVTVKTADDYERMLRGQGGVIPGFAARRSEIVNKINELYGSSTAAVAGDALFDEITALTEAPAVYAGTFSPEFLEVPAECLILSMQQHQKYVPLRDRKSGKLLPRFLFVSNIAVSDPSGIIHGNERVLRARLADARFFYDQDRGLRLEKRVPQLARVVYHNRLGSQLQRVERMQLLAGEIARELGADAQLAERAAWLSKADLLTGMVGEFPELQGVMGAYYARHDGEHAAVADALADQYCLRYDEAGNPENPAGACLYLADRIDALTGLFGIGEKPSGEKDPYALRRAALGVISVYERLAAAGPERRMPPDICELLDYAVTLFKAGPIARDTAAEVHDFILERYRHQLAATFARDAVDAVLSQRPPLAEVAARVQAVEEFRRLPEAASLAAANKRIRNILRKSEADSAKLDESLLHEPAERTLHASLRNTLPQAAARMQVRDYTGAMQAMAALKEPVDAFFDQILVNAEDLRLRNNRHALLRELDALMNQVADISRIAA